MPCSVLIVFIDRETIWMEMTNQRAPLVRPRGPSKITLLEAKLLRPWVQWTYVGISGMRGIARGMFPPLCSRDVKSGCSGCTHRIRHRAFHFCAHGSCVQRIRRYAVRKVACTRSDRDCRGHTGSCSQPGRTTGPSKCGTTSA